MSQPRVARVTRLAYSLPALALAVVGVPVYVFIPKFYTDVVGVDLAAAGLILGLVRVFDAGLDPVIGVLSDKTRTHWGRRRPWIALGAWPLALAMLALLAPRVGPGTPATIWFGVAIFATFFFWTVVTVPYESLGMELSDDYDDRTSLLGLRDGLVILGTLLAACTPLAVSKLLGYPDGREGDRERYLAMALLYAPLLVVLCTACGALVRERPLSTVPIRSGGVIKLLRENRPFFVILAAYGVGALGSNLPGLLMKYYVEGYLRSPHTDVYLVVYFVTGIAVLPGWIALAKRWGKKATWLSAMAVNSGAFFFVFFLGRGDEKLYAVLVCLSGVGFGATLAIPSSMQADVVDYDELLSGERREGLLLGVWCVVRKLAAALPVGVALPLLDWAGYDPKLAAEQPDHVYFVLRILYTVVPSICTAVALWIAFGYPIDRQRHEAILAELAARKTAG